jgi:predicted nucleic acid-binding protein
VNLYLDTSALMKLVLDEPGDRHARALWRRATRSITSVVALPESASALRRALASGRVDPAGHRQAAREIARFLGGCLLVDVDGSIAVRAREAVEGAGLRAADAIHLATAQAIRGPVTFATWDRALADAAYRAGLAVAPA